MQRRIVIAEEQEECCQLFKQFLERCGYLVSAAQDSETCIRILQKGPQPHVLILSWELPPFGGQHVLNWLQDNGITSLSVVAMTCGVTPPGSDSDSPGVMFVQTPLHLLELLNAVREQESAPRDSWVSLGELWKKSQEAPKPEHNRLFPTANADSRTTADDSCQPGKA